MSRSQRRSRRGTSYSSLGCVAAVIDQQAVAEVEGGGYWVPFRPHLPCGEEAADLDERNLGRSDQSTRKTQMAIPRRRLKHMHHSVMSLDPKQKIDKAGETLLGYMIGKSQALLTPFNTIRKPDAVAWENAKAEYHEHGIDISYPSAWGRKKRQEATSRLVASGVILTATRKGPKTMAKLNSGLRLWQDKTLPVALPFMNLFHFLEDIADREQGIIGLKQYCERMQVRGQTFDYKTTFHLMAAPCVDLGLLAQRFTSTAAIPDCYLQLTVDRESAHEILTNAHECEQRLPEISSEVYRIADNVFLRSRKQVRDLRKEDRDDCRIQIPLHPTTAGDLDYGLWAKDKPDAWQGYDGYYAYRGLSHE